MGTPEPAPLVTLTLNPAVDVTTGVPEVVPRLKLRCEPPTEEPGGGGLNSARVIAELGGEVCAVYAAGGSTGDLLDTLLHTKGIVGRRVPVAGDTRRSMAVHERSTGDQFRFVLPGPDLDEPAWEDCVAAVREHASPGALVLASGSQPPGVPDDALARLARTVRQDGARLLVDMAGAPMRSALGEGVFLARFNSAELEEHAGREMPDVGERHRYIAGLVAEGAAEVVVATVGPEGALVATAERNLHLRPPEVAAPTGSPVGAGDSLMGALMLGLARGWPLEEACRLGVAASTAAHLTPGTELCRREDVERLYERTGEPARVAPSGA